MTRTEKYNEAIRFLEAASEEFDQFRASFSDLEKGGIAARVRGRSISDSDVWDALEAMLSDCRSARDAEAAAERADAAKEWSEDNRLHGAMEEC